MPDISGLRFIGFVFAMTLLAVTATAAVVANGDADRLEVESRSAESR
jgi:hypothetical protein